MSQVSAAVSTHIPTPCSTGLQGSGQELGVEPALQVPSGSSFQNAWEQSPDSKAQGQSSGWRKRTPALVREGRETDFTQNTPLQLAAGRGWVQVGVGKMVAPKAVPRLMLNQASERGFEEHSPWVDRGGVAAQS